MNALSVPISPERIAAAPRLAPEPDIWPSAEIRWFQHGVAPELTSWFAQRLPDAQVEERIDEYLCFPGADFVGAKLRAYLAERSGDAARMNLEFKLRERPLGVIPFGSDSAGNGELWRKWSVTLDRDATAYSQAVVWKHDFRWQRVPKRRRLQKFSFAAGAVAPVAAGERPDHGCDVELTSLITEFDIRRSGVIWTSFACEAFSNDPNADLAVILQRTLDELNGEPLPRLDPRDSCGYPAWLNQLCRR